MASGWRKKRRERALEVGRLEGGAITETVESDKSLSQGFPGGPVVENLPANAGDTGSSPCLGRSHMPQSN